MSNNKDSKEINKNKETKGKKQIISEIMEGYYEDNQIWINFEDNTRKFFEKSYYGEIYNEDKLPIYDKFEIMDVDTKTGIAEVKSDDKIPKKKRPVYIVFNALEALYLIERKKLIVKLRIAKNSNETVSKNANENGKDTEKFENISFDKLLEMSMGKVSRIWQKYIVYRDIRQRGYIIRVGYGGKADFRVFSRGAKMSSDTAKLIFYIIQDGIPVALNELDQVVTQVLGDRKKLILAIFDKLGDSTFYELERFNFNKIKDNFDTLWEKDIEVLITKSE